MSEWQPIETAPKDGSLILLDGGKTDEFDYNNEGVPKNRPVTAFYDNEEEAWFFCYWDGCWRSVYNNPTSWMPLPPPPKAETDLQPPPVEVK